MLKTIFVVDDSDVNLLTAEEALSKQYRVFPLASAESMFELLENIKPDLILLDIEMPEMNGFDALRKLNSTDSGADIPVMFLTSRNDASTEALGFELGAMDFISKPFSTPVLLNRIKTHLDVDGLIRERTAELNERTSELEQRTIKLKKLQSSLISVLSEILESRDKATGGHVERTRMYTKILIDAMVERGVYIDEISGWDLELVVSSTRLHDVGKIAVSDLILNKPETLTPEEFEAIKIHAAEGERIIEMIMNQSGDEELLLNAKIFAGYHHERWDGMGYPHKLKGEEIPLQGRIMALSDGYDALVSERSYKPPFSHQRAVDIITEEKGTHFDPKIVDVFLEVNGMFAEVSLCQ